MTIRKMENGQKGKKSGKTIVSELDQYINMNDGIKGAVEPPSTYAQGINDIYGSQIYSPKYYNMEEFDVPSDADIAELYNIGKAETQLINKNRMKTAKEKAAKFTNPTNRYTYFENGMVPQYYAEGEPATKFMMPMKNNGLAWGTKIGNQSFIEGVAPSEMYSIPTVEGQMYRGTLIPQNSLSGFPHYYPKTNIENYADSMYYSRLYNDRPFASNYGNNYSWDLGFDGFPNINPSNINEELGYPNRNYNRYYNDNVINAKEPSVPLSSEYNGKANTRYFNMLEASPEFKEQMLKKGMIPQYEGGLTIKDGQPSQYVKNIYNNTEIAAPLPKVDMPQSAVNPKANTSLWDSFTNKMAKGVNHPIGKTALAMLAAYGLSNYLNGNEVEASENPENIWYDP